LHLLTQHLVADRPISPLLHCTPKAARLYINSLRQFPMAHNGDYGKSLLLCRNNYASGSVSDWLE
jgi:hypothetical protein